MPTTPLLRIEGLAKSFESPAGHLEILKDISFELAGGQFLAVVGESGSGKSTMLQIIGTLDPPDRGEAWLGGESLFSLSKRQQARLRSEKIGFVYQAHHLIPELTALENVMLPLLVQGRSSNAACTRATELLERMHLGERLEHVPARLSGGESQRVAVARALATSPSLLLADEPTGNLDEDTAGQVFGLLRQLCREEGAAVVMVTHSSALAGACDRRLRLHGGTLLEL
ncbi:MAG TPA: ABC transporter ATP-binding protein [Mariprofundaceae bacterium]|nr:ABC transporter ATP-binding protein [Mariprofundaceae bacterium]